MARCPLDPETLETFGFLVGRGSSDETLALIFDLDQRGLEACRAALAAKRADTWGEAGWGEAAGAPNARSRQHVAGLAAAAELDEAEADLVELLTPERQAARGVVAAEPKPQPYAAPPPASLTGTGRRQGREADRQVAAFLARRGARRFEAGLSSSFAQGSPLVLYLEAKGHTASFRGQSLKPVLLDGRPATLAEALALVDSYRIADGLAPIGRTEG